MENEVIILIAEDDDGHATLIEKNLKRTGIKNNTIRFHDGEEVCNFLLEQGPGPHRVHGKSYLLLLDIRMPKINGIEVLENIKKHVDLKSMPIIMLTTTDDPREVDKCHKLGCNSYITKPIDYNAFLEAIKNLGLFLKVVQIPRLNGLDKV